MNNYKITIQYDGGRYKGWQRLGNGENTIQEKLETILFDKIGKRIEIVGCSRTDAGVHALAQTANFKIEECLTHEEVKELFNRYLPTDIRILEVKLVSEHFHARYNAQAKNYLYKIWNKEYPNPFLRKYSSHVQKSLSLDKMRQAANCFIGVHDFTAFSSVTVKKKSMVREIYSITIVEENGLVLIRVKGNSFLYNMVRRIVGLLIEVGLGNISIDSVLIILDGKERNNKASYIAEAKGLFLENIEY